MLDTIDYSQPYLPSHTTFNTPNINSARRKSITQGMFLAEPTIPQQHLPSFDSYEMIRHAFDMQQPTRSFNDFNKISIKSEQNAFKNINVEDSYLQPHNQQQYQVQDYYNYPQTRTYEQTNPFFSTTTSSVNSKNKNLQEKMNKLTFQRPTEALEDIQRQTITKTLKTKSRKLYSNDSPNKVENPANLFGTVGELVNGRRKWTSYEDNLLRKAVSVNGEKNWKNIAVMVNGRNHVQCLQRWKKVLKPGLIKGHWTSVEDDKLRNVVSKGYKNWGEVSQQIVGRTAKQCRERWCCNLDPSIKRDKWSEEEDMKILTAQQEIGNKWSTIAQMLPGRTENAIKTRAKSLQRRARKEWTTQEDNIIVSLKTMASKLPCELSSDDDEVDVMLGLKRSNAWAKIAEKLPGRSKNAVKKRWKELRTTFPPS